jgi:hypothetical protein
MVDTIKNSSTFSFAGREFVRVSAELCGADVFGGWKARWGVGRMSYLIKPGLYAVGSPEAESEVLVTANYKMTFDRVRRVLDGRDCWILVLDTKGINVWCAAGKGTFGTDEIVRCVQEFNLAEIVSHKSLVVPQLGAPGVSAHKVKTQCGFKVLYGPVRAADIPAFMDAGMVADDEMRRVRFPLADRVVLIPMDILMWAKQVVFIVMFFVLAGGLHKKGFAVSNCLHEGCGAAGLFLLAYLAGGVLGPVLLPILPGRSFSLKGVWIGLGVWLAVVLFGFEAIKGGFSLASWGLMMPAVSSAIVMNFTGTSTYTSLSGVMREMRIAVPLQAIAAAIGVGLWVTSLFV